MKSLSIVFFLVVLLCASAAAQTTAFTFQGSMQVSGSPANGNFDFEFKLFDQVSGGAQQSFPVQRLNVAVVNGTFTVSLDFGAGTLPGADRFLDIAVRPAGGGAFTALTPRQKINSAPYSIKSLSSTTADTATNATQLGGVAANQYVVTTDPRMTDARNPLPNSPNYIRNSAVQQQAGASLWISGSGNFGGPGNFDGGLSVGSNFAVGGNTTLVGNLTVNGTLTGNLPSGDADYVQNRTTAQAGTNFNISGNGTVGGTLAAGTVQASNVNGNIITGVITNSSVYRIGDQNILTNFGTRNVFAGVDAGGAGTDNSFFGFNAGNANLAGGTDNSFFGSDAGGINTTGSENSFFGSDTGDSNTTGLRNSFFGRSAGSGNSTGDDNSFFGHNAGLASSTANGNSFFGKSAGEGATGTFNSIFGANAGQAAGSGGSNAFFGYLAGGANTTGSNNSFFGKNAGDSNQGGSFNSFFGTLAGTANTSGASNTFIGINAGDTNTTGSNNTVIGGAADLGANNLNYATAIGAGTVVSTSNTIRIGRADGSDQVRTAGRIYALNGMQVGESGDNSSIFVYGDVNVGGNGGVNADYGAFGQLSKGGGSFKIDHPLDPKNKYLYHSFVESPDMMNIYNGIATTDAEGSATIKMPTYFEALNRDFRYQLTVIGTFAQAIVAEEITGNQFKIRTDKPGVKVSWQVTGVRQDPYAEQNRIQPEVEKPDGERGTYLYPKAYESTLESERQTEKPLEQLEKKENK